MNQPYICPECGRDYPVPPKWCPCRPFPMDDPYEATFLVELMPGRPLEAFDPDFNPSVTTLMAGADPPFRSAVLLHKGMGWEEMVPLGEESQGELGTLAEWLDHLFRLRPGRSGPGGGETERILLRETFSPGVETLDTLTWRVVDVTGPEAERLLALAAE